MDKERQITVTVTASWGGHSWNVLDEDGATVAALSKRLVRAIREGRADRCSLIADRDCLWARKLRKIAALIRQEGRDRGQDPWPVKLGAIAKSISMRMSSGEGGARELHNTSWDERCRRMVASLKYQKRRDNKDDWTKWCDSHAANLAARDRNKAYRQGQRG